LINEFYILSLVFSGKRGIYEEYLPGVLMDCIFSKPFSSFSDPYMSFYVLTG
jgi:hypothetical protein